MKQIALILLVLMALVTIQTQKLRNAVIYMGVFSLSISFVYMFYNAPDVAIAEAVIGSTLATILYMVALQKYKIFTVYIHVEEGEVSDEHFTNYSNREFISLVEVFCAKQELEPQIIYTIEDVEHIMENHKYSLIIKEDDGKLKLIGHPENFKMDDLETYMTNAAVDQMAYEIIKP